MLWSQGDDSFVGRVQAECQDASFSASIPAWYNSVSTQVASKKAWRHFEGYALLECPAPYDSGTVLVSAGSPVVTGTGTIFPASAGQIFKGPDEREYRILSKDSDTQLTLIGDYLGDTTADAAFQIIFNRVELPTDIALPRIEALVLQNSQGGSHRIYQIDTDEMLDRNPEQARFTTAQPYRYRFREGDIFLWPPPNVRVGIECYYKRTWTKASTATVATFDLSTDWPEELQEVILLGVIARGYRYMENDLSASYERDYRQALDLEAARNARGPDVGAQMRRWDDRRRNNNLSPGTLPRRYPGS